MAVSRVVQEHVRPDAAILTDTVRKRRLAEHWEEARRNVACRIIEKRLLIPDETGEQMRPGVGRRADDDAVEIIRVALRLHQGLAATIRTAIEIRPLRPLADERCYDGLGLVGRFFERAIPEVDNLLGVTQSEGRLSSRLAAVVRRRGGIPACDRVREAAITDAAAEPAAAELLVLSVETAVRRDPDLEIDDRIIRRRRGAGNPAELRELGIRSAAGTTRR